MTREPQPDFLIIGAPKAGTTALHATLTQHPQVFMASPKEPKYWLCDDAPPPHYSGPGDRHSQQEWVWRTEDYARLFAGASRGQLRGESTPFYLWSRGAQQRIAAALPDVRLIAVVRDPVDRAYSNWMHLWSDGLEPVADFEEAFNRQDDRVRDGWAPMWRYRELGMYGEQLAHLRGLVDRDRLLVLRYRDLVDTPAAAVDRAARFLGIQEGRVASIPRDNSRDFVLPGLRPTVLGPVVRAGATLGQFAPPQVWRHASSPLVRRLSGRAQAHRPLLAVEQRARMVAAFQDDIDLLGDVVEHDFSDWHSHLSRGSFSQRAGGAATG